MTALRPLAAFAAVLALAGPAAAVGPAAAQASSAAPAVGPVTIRNDMPVISSDGVEVAKAAHITGGEKTFGPDEMFFTADRYYSLRRMYGREVYVAGGAVRLRMTAAQFRARHQNPDQ